MFLLIGLAVLFVVCICAVRVRGEIDIVAITSIIGAVIFGFLLLFGSILLPVQRYDTMAHIAEFNATKETLKNARSNGNVLENAALQQKVVECNAWLASSLYYKSTIFGFWIPDEILSLDPMK
jgi:hypothetical protein